jgi:hypothetical protein
MTFPKLSTTLTIAAATATLAAASPAYADPMVESSRRMTAESVDTTPNADLIASGLFTFAIPYVASVVVANESTRREDRYLYTPVAGPWLDLANRDECPAVGSCSNETAFKILLVADGVLQGFGALEVLAGLAFPETRPTTTTTRSYSSPQVRVAPSVTRASAGLTAFGRF